MVFFRKEPSKYEVINDKDSDLVAFYRVLQNHLEEFLKQFKWILSSREWFEDYKRQQEAGGLPDGTFEYIKYASVDQINFRYLEKSSYIDVETVYGQDTNAEGDVQYVGVGVDTPWSIVRNSAGGTSYDSTSSIYYEATENVRGMIASLTTFKTTYFVAISRGFLRFNISSEDEASAVSLFVRGHLDDASSVAVQKGTQGETLGMADYNNFYGSAYDTVNWSAAGYNEFEFNSTGISDFNSAIGGYFELCMRETHDYNNIAPSNSTYCNGWRSYDYTGTSSDPYLEYEPAPTASLNLTQVIMVGM